MYNRKYILQQIHMNRKSTQDNFYNMISIPMLAERKSSDNSPPGASVGGASGVTIVASASATAGATGATTATVTWTCSECHLVNHSKSLTSMIKVSVVGYL